MYVSLHSSQADLKVRLYDTLYDTRGSPLGRAPAREIRHVPRRAGQLQDVHAGVGAIDGVDVAAIVDLDVVRLDRDLAPLGRALADTPLVGVRRRRGNVVADLLEVVRV